MWKILLAVFLAACLMPIVSHQAKAQKAVTPTLYCGGSNFCIPSTTLTPVSEGTTPPVVTKTATTPVPTTPKQIIHEPCESTTSTVARSRRHHSQRGHGLMQGFWQFLIQWINQILERLGKTPISRPSTPPQPIKPCKPTQTQPIPTTTRVPQATTNPIASPTIINPTTLPAATPPPQGQNSKVSVGFYPGWYQSTTPPNQIDYTPWTHIMHFGFYPTTSGTVGNGDMDPSYPAPAINAAHGAGKKILVTIGGAGSGSGFVSSTNASTLSTFVTNIVAHMKRYGYDGVDIDWEENVSQTPFVNLITQLRTALNKESPQPILSVDVDSDLVPPSVVSKIASQVDIINVMSYWDNGTAMMKAYTDAGIPANKLTFGIGFSPELYDQTADKVQTKVNYAKQQGFLGVMTWSMENARNTDPRLQPLRDFVSGK